MVRPREVNRHQRRIHLSHFNVNGRRERKIVHLHLGHRKEHSRWDLELLLDLTVQLEDDGGYAVLLGRGLGTYPASQTEE